MKIDVIVFVLWNGSQLSLELSLDQCPTVVTFGPIAFERAGDTKTHVLHFVLYGEPESARQRNEQSALASFFRNDPEMA